MHLFLCFTFVYQFAQPTCVELLVVLPPDAPSAMFNYTGASCALQFDLNLPESLSYLAGAHFSAPLTAQIFEA